ncbi:hypothetical protein I2W78_14000 [Streptomyces spinoverrucosus]|uniref:hypothetical protein n=1 Tax=Streptomyces spinoverrucosus TaxID=284043 RepID=UPI0018C3BEE4|nr:hypothetical protein [Streptomyces spinoverrucosus]MBG0852927.1 hypothetical protein [Streptomyces spinoverrucosus]
MTAGVGCLLSALVIAVVPLPEGAGQARAATSESSAVTKKGTKGKYDFSELEVTVHQTKGLNGQGVRVTWKGGEPSNGVGTNFLSLMQCWGDEASGPDRTQCEFGRSAGAQPGDGRGVFLSDNADGYDPLETETGTSVDQNGTRFVPFRPVPGQGDPTTAATDSTYFTQGDTNAVPFLPNDGNGGGDMAFEVKSAVEQPALGCGARRTSAGAIQPCWLVVVPRGTHDANGDPAKDRILRSPSLSRSNWDQRIAFRLDFEPVTDNCDPDKPERQIMGSELATDAITSWQGNLCATGTHRFTYTQSSEQHARDSVASADSLAGLAMTVDPVQPADGVVHAPVAINGLTIGFVWMYDQRTGEGSNTVDRPLPLKNVKLNQRLLAKVLTQSYPSSLVPTNEQTPTYVSGNPRSIGMDPEFQQLNPGLEDLATNERLAPLGLAVSSENSDSARLVWDYILADRDAKEFIEGEQDPWGMKVNPKYEDGVISDSLDYFPKADLTSTTLNCPGGSTPIQLTRTGQDVVPYVTDMHEGALKVRRGDIGTAYECSATGTLAKMTPLGRPVPTKQRQFGIVDNASAVRYQLNAAALPNADGEYVKPTDTSLLEAVAQMPDSEVPGVKAPDPAKMKDGAYPLATVVYAAASLGQAEDARQDYADVLRYAADQGQTQGTAKGRLPHGYAPLPTALRQQARQAADQLEKGAAAAPQPSNPEDPASNDGPDTGGGGTAGGLDGGTGAGGLGGGDPAGAAGGATGPAGAGGPGSGTSRPDPSETDPAKQNVAQSGGLTPSEVLGLIRWVLLGVLVAGGVAGLAGPTMVWLSTRRAAGSG